MNWHSILNNFLGWMIAYLFYFLGTRLVLPYVKYFALDKKKTTTCATCSRRDDYAAYTYLASRFSQKIPFFGKYVLAFLASFWFSHIIKQGEQVWQRKMINRSAQSATQK